MTVRDVDWPPVRRTLRGYAASTTLVLSELPAIDRYVRGDLKVEEFFNFFLFSEKKLKNYNVIFSDSLRKSKFLNFLYYYYYFFFLIHRYENCFLSFSVLLCNKDLKQKQYDGKPIVSK